MVVGNAHQLVRKDQRGKAAQRLYYPPMRWRKVKSVWVFLSSSQKLPYSSCCETGKRQALPGERAAFQLRLERQVSSFDSDGNIGAREMIISIRR